MLRLIDLRRLLAEFLGTAGIVATVVGTGHMVRVLDSDATVGLILMAMAVGGTLFGAIALLMPISGAHFNPAVTLIMWLEKKIELAMGVQYIAVQVLGAISGAVVANLMFMDDLVSSSLGARLNAGTMLGEVVATFGLVLLILLFVRHDQLHLIAPGVALWIIAGHFFTSSTSFANPAVTIGRSFTDTATGIDWQATVAFIPMQLVGALLALLVFKVFYPNKEKEQHV
jgi:glycerol uptake facilitator-like aquaporin